ncbi:MAG: hypothetical protein ACI9N1_000776, partial [Flavobacteriales bacterium]
MRLKNTILIIIITLINTTSFGQEKWQPKLDSTSSGIEKLYLESYDGYSPGTIYFTTYVLGKQEGWAFEMKRTNAWFFYYKNDELVKALNVKVDKQYDWSNPPYELIKNILVYKKSIPQKRILKEINIKEGVLNGVFAVYDYNTGIIREKANFENGVPNGKYIRYFGEKRIKVTVNFSEGKPDTDFYYTLSETDTSSYFNLDLNRSPYWESLYDYKHQSNYQLGFNSSVMYLDDIIFNGITPLIKGEFKDYKETYYYKYFGGYSNSIHCKEYIYGNIADTTILKNHFPNSRGTFYQEIESECYYAQTNTLWRKSKMVNGKVIGRQKKYNQNGIVYEEYIAVGKGDYIDSLYQIIDDSVEIKRDYYYSLHSKNLRKTQRIERLERKNGEKLKIYYDHQGDTLGFYKKDSLKSNDFLLAEEMIDKNGKIYYSKFNRNHSFFEKNEFNNHGDFILKKDTLFFDNTNQISEIGNYIVFINTSYSDSILKHGYNTSYNKDGSIKEKGNYFYNVQIGEWEYWESDKLIHSIKYDSIGEVEGLEVIPYAKLAYPKDIEGSSLIFSFGRSQNGRYSLASFEGDFDSFMLIDLKTQKIINPEIFFDEEIRQIIQDSEGEISNDGKTFSLCSSWEKIEFIKVSLETGATLKRKINNDLYDYGISSFSGDEYIYIAESETFLFNGKTNDNLRSIIKYSFETDSIESVVRKHNERSKLFLNETKGIFYSIDGNKVLSYDYNLNIVDSNSINIKGEVVEYSNDHLFYLHYRPYKNTILSVYNLETKKATSYKLKLEISKISGVTYYKNQFTIIVDGKNRESIILSLDLIKSKLSYPFGRFLKSEFTTNNKDNCDINIAEQSDFKAILYKNIFLGTLEFCGSYPTAYYFDLSKSTINRMVTSTLELEPDNSTIIQNGNMAFYSVVDPLNIEIKSTITANEVSINWFSFIAEVDLSTAKVIQKHYDWIEYKDHGGYWGKDSAFNKIVYNELDLLYPEPMDNIDTTFDFRECIVLDKFSNHNESYEWHEGHLDYRFSADSVFYFKHPQESSLTFYNRKKKKVVDRTVTLQVKTEGDFIFYSPDNYYCGSSGIFKDYNFTFENRSYRMEQFDLKFNRPDIILDRLGYADSSLVQSYYKAYQKRLKKMGFTEDMLKTDFHLPEIKIENFEYMPTITDSSSIRLNLNIEDTKYNLDRINIWINDVAVYGSDGITLRDKNIQTFQTKVDLNLVNGNNKVQVSVLNQAGAESYKETFEVECTSGKQKPDLYIITIGDSKFKDANYNLTYAAKDAQDIADLF